MNAADIMQNLKERFWGLTEQNANLLVHAETPAPAISIETITDFKRACRLYDEMNRSVPRDDWRSPAALRLLTLGSEIIRFGTDYKEEYGRSPDEDPIAMKLPQSSDDRRALRTSVSYLLAIGSIEDSGQRRPSPRGRPAVVYIARHRLNG
jgi:hypothetical protein